MIEVVRIEPMAQSQQVRGGCKWRKIGLLGLAVFVGFGLMAMTPIGSLVAFMWAYPVFDIFWGPLRFYLPLLTDSYPILFWLYPLWWILLLLVACRRHRKTAVVLYGIHVTGGPLMRYLLHGDAPFYLMGLHQPMLWVLWSPMLAFTVWYFTMAFGIRWREVGRRVRARWQGWRGASAG